MFEVLMPLQHHPSGNDCCGEGARDRADRFDDVYPGIYVIDLGLPVGEQALFGQRRSVGYEWAAELGNWRKTLREG